MLELDKRIVIRQQKDYEKMADVQNTAVTKGKERLLLLLHTILPPSHKVPEIYYIHTRWQGDKILDSAM